MVLAVVALVVVIPFILLPAVFIWYLNIGGIATAIREAREAKEEKVITEKNTN